MSKRITCWRLERKVLGTNTLVEINSKMTYSGFSNNDKALNNARKLGESLDQLGLKYIPDPFYFAGYDSPFKLINRRNEIWFKAQ
ncbi:unnamed protein product [Schistosoma margrebowiei]|uniref:Uncharacterized protein n=1 Tax=Schistosoma margrebowiei TaxID=48269 RepID=A0A183MCP6_9TREM|nr:unnamed protein product [Schistosoma margrebowiei]